MAGTKTGSTFCRLPGCLCNNTDNYKSYDKTKIKALKTLVLHLSREQTKEISSLKK